MAAAPMNCLKPLLNDRAMLVPGMEILPLKMSMPESLRTHKNDLQMYSSTKTWVKPAPRPPVPKTNHKGRSLAL